jgi:group I intron endonuclease
MAIVYKITNLINNKSYIGATTKTIEQRWDEHVKVAEKVKSNKTYKICGIHYAISKYGINAFKIETLCEHPDINHVFEFLEPKYILEHNTFSELGYNNTPGGDGNPRRITKDGYARSAKSRIGSKRSPETKKKMSRWQIGRKLSKEVREKIGKSMIGKKNMSKSHKDKIREAINKKYKILNTDTGEIFEVLNLRQYRIENKIPRAISNGRWGKFRIIKVTEKIRYITIFNVITGETVVVSNLQKFCKEKEIYPNSLITAMKMSPLNEDICKGYRIVKIDYTDKVNIKTWNDLTVIVDF